MCSKPGGGTSQYLKQVQPLNSLKNQLHFSTHKLGFLLLDDFAARRSSRDRLLLRRLRRSFDRDRLSLDLERSER